MLRTVYTTVAGAPFNPRPPLRPSPDLSLDWPDKAGAAPRPPPKPWN